MITIVRHYDGFDVVGHAGFAPHGQDIVCAAVSALLQTFEASVKDLTTDEIKCVISAGNAVMRYGNLSGTAQTLLDSFFIGCRMIAETYPDNVRVSEP